MIQPGEVNHARFPIEDGNIIYNDGEFSVAWGAWDSGTNGLGMRWNGSPGRNGFPTAGPNFRPVWLVIPLHLSVPFLASLLGKPSANTNAILRALQELEARGAITPRSDAPESPAA